MHKYETMRLIPFLFVLLFLGCKSLVVPTTSKGDNEKLAKEMARKYIIVDGHVDLPYRLKVNNFRFEKEYLGIPIATNEGDFDYERSKEGGLDAPFMSIYIPADNQKESGASKALAEELIEMVEGICEEHPDKFEVAKSVNDVKRIFEEGKIALPMGMENGAGLEDDLDNVAYFKERGISYITLTHSKVNLICDSSYDTIRTWNGLSPYGEQVVKEMNNVGIIVDISHVSDSTFFDVVRMTDVPVIASHSSARNFTPGFERNMSDDLIRALGENGGVIMINFGSSFLDGELNKRSDEMRNKLTKLMEEKGVSFDSEDGKKYIEDFQKKNPRLFADVEIVADHIDHIVSLIGVDHVGLGSDFDGVGDSLPTGLKDVSDYPNLIKVLLDRGYKEADIEKICSANVLRVWQAVEDYAASQ